MTNTENTKARFVKFILDSGMTKSEIMRTASMLANAYDDATRAYSGMFALVLRAELLDVRSDFSDAGIHLWKFGE